jgi:hypothetical protein
LRFQVSDILLGLGRTDEALKELELVAPDGPLGHKAKELRTNVNSVSKGPSERLEGKE